jgi:murein DD-endopeptidase MepM/ murein hydrolase activator NlpD
MLGRRLLPAVLIVVAATMIARPLAEFARSRQSGRANFQQADTPPALPIHGEIDPRCLLQPAWTSARIPLSASFDPPLGTEHGSLVYNAQPFDAMNSKRGGKHLGDDLNGIGGMDTDLGDPVFSPGDGLVVYAGEPSPGWGKTLVIAHRLADGRTLHSMLAHLHDLLVPRGALVGRGEKVGSVGTANSHYPAHLHFEVRDSDEVDIGAGYGPVPLNRIDPAAHIHRLRPVGQELPLPSALAIARQPATAPACPDTPGSRPGDAAAK